MNFSKSSFQTVSEFMNNFLKAKFDSDLQAIKKYLKTLFISMLFFSRQSYTILKFQEILQIYETREMFEFYNETKNIALSMQNLGKATFVDLEQVYLNVSERAYILNQIFGFGGDELKSFNDLMINEAKAEKTKKKQVMKQDEVSLPFLLHCCMIQFQKRNNNAQLQQQEIKKIKTRMTILNQNLPRRDTGLLTKMTVLMKKGLLNDIPIDDADDLQEEIKIVQQQIKETIQKKFHYKNSSIKLMSILKSIDQFTSEIKRDVNQRFDQLKQVKNKTSKEIHDQLDSEFDPVIRSKLYTGSEIQNDSTRRLMSNLLKMDPAFYKLLERRIAENHPRFQSQIKKMKTRILAENVNLGSQEVFKIHELKQELEGIFQDQSPKSEDYDILQAIVYGRELKNDQISIQNLLHTQCNKIDSAIDLLLEEDKDCKDEEVIKNFSTVNQNLLKIQKMDEFEFSKYHSEAVGGTNQQQTRLDRLITKQMENLSNQLEHQVSQKEIKQRLTQQMFDQCKIEQLVQENRNFVKQSEPVQVEETIDMNDDNFESISQSQKNHVEQLKSESRKILMKSESEMKNKSSKKLNKTEMEEDKQTQKIDSSEEKSEPESEAKSHSEIDSDGEEDSEVEEEKSEVEEDKSEVEEDKSEVEEEKSNVESEAKNSDRKSIQSQQSSREKHSNKSLEENDSHESKSHEQNNTDDQIDSDDDVKQDDMNDSGNDDVEENQDDKTIQSGDENHEEIEESEEEQPQEEEKENSEDLNNEGTQLVDSEMEIRESDIQKMSIEEQKQMMDDCLERETLMREQFKPKEGVGRESYNLANMVKSNKLVKKYPAK